MTGTTSGSYFQVIFCCNISYNSPNSSTLSTRKLSTNRYDKCCYAEISTIIADQGSCMSRFCPSYAAYSVTVSCQIALFQQLVHCIRADSVDSADSTDSAISVTPDLAYHRILIQRTLHVHWCKCAKFCTTPGYTKGGRDRRQDINWT